MARVTFKRYTMLKATDGSSYHVINLIGEGSYSKVYVATDLGTGQAVAIKKFKDIDQQAFHMESLIYQTLSERQAALT